MIMYNRKKGLTIDEALRIFYDEDTGESDFTETDDCDNEGEEENNECIHHENDANVSRDELNITEDDSESEENLINYEWTSNVENTKIKLEQFSSSSGPVHSLPTGSSALNYLRLFMTDDLCEIIMSNTNKYAEFCEKERKKKDETWRPIRNIDEIWCFFGILLVMSIVNMPKISGYWSESSILGNQMVKKLMSRGRFLKIKHYFHISDREKEIPKTADNFTYSQKLEPMYSYIKSKFQTHFNPYKQLSIDEAMVKYKGRLGIVQYMPLKPAKRGLKMWMLCTSKEGYTYNFDIYGGKKR